MLALDHLSCAAFSKLFHLHVVFLELILEQELLTLYGYIVFFFILAWQLGDVLGAMTLIVILDETSDAQVALAVVQPLPQGIKRPCRTFTDYFRGGVHMLQNQSILKMNSWVSGRRMNTKCRLLSVFWWEHPFLTVLLRASTWIHGHLLELRKLRDGLQHLVGRTLFFKFRLHKTVYVFLTNLIHFLTVQFYFEDCLFFGAKG